MNVNNQALGKRKTASASVAGNLKEARRRYSTRSKCKPTSRLFDLACRGDWKAASRRFDTNQKDILWVNEKDERNIIHCIATKPWRKNAAPLSLVRDIINASPHWAVVQQDKYGYTPLHRAAQYDADIKVFQLLLAAANNASAALVTKMFPSFPHDLLPTIVSYISDKPLLIQDRLGRVPLGCLHWTDANIDQARFLFEAAPSACEFLLLGQLPRLHQFCALELEESRHMLKLVAEHIPKELFVSRDSIRGRTPLHCAVESYTSRYFHAFRHEYAACEENIRLLIEICPSALLYHDSHGRTPIDVALARYCHRGLFEILERSVLELFA